MLLRRRYKTIERILASLFFILVLSQPLLADQAEEVDACFSSWEKHELNRAVVDCTLAANSGVLSDPVLATVFWIRSEGHLFEQNSAEAMRDVNLALKLDWNFALAHRTRGNIYFDQHDYDRAINDYHETEKRDAPLTPYVKLGFAYAARRNYKQALHYYDLAVKQEPENSEAYRLRGAVYMRERQFDQAFNDFNKALELEPRNAEAYTDRARAYTMTGDHARAIGDFSRAIEFDPKLARAYTLRGGEYGQIGDYDRALADLDHAIELEPNAVFAYTNRSGVYAIKKRFLQAMADAETAILMNPDLPVAYLARSTVYWEMGDFDRAIEDIDRVIRINPEYPDIQGVREKALAAKKKKEQSDAPDPNIAR